MKEGAEGQPKHGVLEPAPAQSDRFVFSTYFKPLTLTPIPDEQDREGIETIRQLLQSEMGYLFLDRTRLSPRGFVTGEHVFALSLAPGEEVVVEQRSFSKREVTFEEQSEQEKQLDLELSSTLSTELAEGLDRETSKNEQSGLNLGGSVGGDILGVNVNAEASYSSNVTEASNQVSKRSVKDSSVASSKLASKYRATHRMTFKVATEDRFELTSKRVIKNPNAYRPVDLHYFKVLRELELTQERYGVRLCWAPAVADPAADVLVRINLGRQQIIERAISAVELPQRPVEPPKPEKPPIVQISEIKEADKWGFSGDMSADYELAIPIPPDYVWNGDVDEVRALSSVWGRPSDNMGWKLEGRPWVDADRLMVKIHVGAGMWFGGPKIYLQAKAKFIPDPTKQDAQYKEAYDRWKAEVAAWEADVAMRQEGPRRQAVAQADEWERSLRAGLNPVVELMDRIAKQHLVGPLSDEPWEVEFWGQVFDWKLAGITLYPSWWRSGPAREPLKGPEDFLNASWAKLYLPVRPGFERLALRWIIGRLRDGQSDSANEDAFARIAEDLAAFRETTFGDARETSVGGPDEEHLQDRYLKLARWTELLPTDGTHVEVALAESSAIDDFTQARLEEDRRIAATKTAGEEQDVELKKRAAAAFGSDKGNLTYSVAITTEDGNHKPDPADAAGRSLQ